MYSISSSGMMQVDKDATGEITQRDLFGVVYVPLTDRPKGDV